MTVDYQQLALNIKQWGQELGFQQIGICDTELMTPKQYLAQWLDKKYHGEMEYMSRHQSLRSNPTELIPETQSVICARINYLPPNVTLLELLKQKNFAYISRYALGRDYHKLIRKRLVKLANKISAVTGEFIYRPFADSAPVMEKPLAVKSGLGWMGKHTNLINRQAGSWFFLGTMYTNLPLPHDTPIKDHCGRCQACIDICPTQAIVAPYQLDASRCISYLTIELRGSIPIHLRPLIGNRIYGCDDCQAICPWNRFAKITNEKDFLPRNDFDRAQLLTLFNWSETEFLNYTEGSAIRRIGHDCWLRNIAVALGNAPYDEKIILSLQEKINHPSSLVHEHVNWALEQQLAKKI